jgi:hypothetical protein
MPHHLVYDGDLLYSRSLVTLEKPQGLTLESQRVLTDKSFDKESVVFPHLEASLYSETNV